jgi:hypothetical protein
MKASEITRQNMVDKLIELFPELKERFDEQAKTFDRDLAHIYYSFVYFEHIKEMFSSGREDATLLRRLFDFAELLVGHQDNFVDDVAIHSICVNIANDELTLQKAMKYLGPKTRKACLGIVKDVNSRE